MIHQNNEKGSVNISASVYTEIVGIKALMEPLITLISGSGLPSKRQQHSVPNALGSRESVRFPSHPTMPQGPKTDISNCFCANGLDFTLQEFFPFPSTLMHSPEFC